MIFQNTLKIKSTIKANSLALILLSLIIPFSNVLNARDITEQDIKAVYLYNFLRFVTWPDTKKTQIPPTFEANKVTICILGKDTYPNAFQTVENLPLKSDQRILTIDRFDSFSSITPLLHCHLLFITASEQDKYPAIIESLNRKNILLVGETSGFIESGGMVEFHRVGEKIRWKINLSSVNQAGFKIDRRILQIATQVLQRSRINNIDKNKQLLFLAFKTLSTTSNYSSGDSQ